MNKISNIAERKGIKDLLNKHPNEHENVHRVISSHGNIWCQQLARDLHVLDDIIIHHPNEDAFAVFTKWKNEKSQSSRQYLRYGKRGLDDFKARLSRRKHGKTVSHFSVKYWIDRGLTPDQARIKVKGIQSNNAKRHHSHATTLDYRRMNPLCIEYWIHNGYDLEAAIAQRCEYMHKHGRSYTAFHKKYGKDLGQQKMQDAQAKRKQTLLDRYEVTTFGGNQSYVGNQICVELYKRCRLLGVPRAQIHLGVKGSREFASRFNDRNVFYDFVIRDLKIAVEFNGCYWHPREDLVWRRKDINKDEATLKDHEKHEHIRARGFELFVIWEDDNIEEQINKIMKRVKYAQAKA